MTHSPTATPRIHPNRAERVLEITWADGECNRFHYVWLRHHARCSEGMPNDSSVKIDLLPDDPATLAIASCSVEDACLVIDWRDTVLQTRHDLATLRGSAYDHAARMRRKHQPLLWDRAGARRIARFEFTDLERESSLLDLIRRRARQRGTHRSGQPVTGGQRIRADSRQ